MEHRDFVHSVPEPSVSREGGTVGDGLGAEGGCDTRTGDDSSPRGVRPRTLAQQNASIPAS